MWLVRESLLGRARDACKAVRDIQVYFSETIKRVAYALCVQLHIQRLISRSHSFFSIERRVSRLEIVFIYLSVQCLQSKLAMFIFPPLVSRRNCHQSRYQTVVGVRQSSDSYTYTKPSISVVDHCRRCRRSSVPQTPTLTLP